MVDYEIVINIKTNEITIEINKGISNNFLSLSDTPSTYVSQASKFLKVNSGETGLEFSVSSGGGTWGSIGGTLADQSEVVTEADTIASNDNDTTFPTSAAVKAYADSVAGAGGTWGSITGTLSDQTDLNSAFSGKQDTITNSDSISEGSTNLFLTTTERSNISTNNAKVTNVTTNLSEGTATETTVDVNSSDGSNATLASASTTRAGLLTKAKYDEIVANTSKISYTDSSAVSSNTSHRGLTTGNPHSVSKSDVGLGNVPNTDCTNASNISSGTISSSILPPIALTTVTVYATEAAMLAATTEEGDVAVRSDEGKSYMRNSGTAGDMTDWTELQTPTDTVLSVNGETGTVTLSTGDLSEDTNKKYVTDAQLTLLGNTSGSNSGDNATNTQYSSLVSNVTTNLSEGTATETTVDVNSSDGSNATLASASTTRAGLLSKAKYDEIVANTLKISFDSTSSSRLANTSGTNTGDNATNTQYSSLVSNVTTNLSEGTATETTVDVNSSDGDNATLVSASTTRAGLLTKAKWDEIVANTSKVSFDSTSSSRLANTSGTNTGDNATNTQYSSLVTNATHTGDVTGSGALTVDKTAITGKTLVTVASDDNILISDTSDTGNLKKIAASDLLGGVGDMVLASVQSVTGLKTFDTIKLAVKGSSTGTTAIASANDSATDYTATLQAATGTLAYTSDITGTNSGTNTGDNATNTQYSSLVSNVTTNLSEGTATETTVDVNSSDGDNATLVSASTTRAGLLTKAKFDEIVANTSKDTNATHTGDVTGSGALTVDKTAITGKTEVTAVGTDYVIISDTSDTGNLKKALVSDLLNGGISDVVDDTTPQLGGYLDLNDFGITLELKNNTGGSLSAGDVCYVNSSGELALTDADTEASSVGMVVLVTETITDSSTGTCLVEGVYTTTSLTAGATYYLSTTAGDYTSTKPSATGDFVRIIGYALSTTKLYFKVDNSQVKHL